jgi:RNA polymerase-binding protein DksA
MAALGRLIQVNKITARLSYINLLISIHRLVGEKAMPTLSPADLKHFKTCLEDRLKQLEEDIRRQLLRSENETYQELAGRTHDSGDESLAELLMSTNLSLAESELTELRDVEAALTRISGGNYGVCIDCGVDIDPRRLEGYPTAKRCTDCQTRYENLAKDRSPSL